MQQITIALLVAFSAVTGWKEYVDEEKRFKFKYPDTWVQKMNDDIVSLAPDNQDSLLENINLIVMDLQGAPVTLDQIVDATKQQIEELDNSKLLSVKNTTMANEKAKEMIFLTKGESGGKVKAKQYFMMKDNVAYIFLYTATASRFADHEDLANKTVQSLEFF